MKSPNVPRLDYRFLFNKMDAFFVITLILDVVSNLSIEFVQLT